MTLLFQKSNFCGNFITFLEVSKFLITNYFLNVTVLTVYRQRADHKKVFAVKTTRCVLVRNVFVITPSFWHYQRITLDWLLMLDFQPIKTVCV